MATISKIILPNNITYDLVDKDARLSLENKADLEDVVTYSLSISGNVITLIGSNNINSTINLPIYDGTVV